MGLGPEGTEQADSQGQLPSQEHTGYPAKYARSYSVLIPRCMLTLSHSKNQTRKQGLHSLYQPIQDLSIYPDVVWIS